LALLDVLRTACVSDPEQQVAKERMLRFAYDHVDALDRRCEAGHFTGSALVVDVEAARTLVLFHTRAQRWLQPGGHADGEADLASVALREAREETGIDGLRVVRPAIDLDIHVFRPRDGEPRVHLDVRFLVVTPPGAQPKGNHESEELRWVDLPGLIALDADEGLIRLARAGFELARRV
jgi:8-oxo-dGTP pyrophosphatase MutT (NUDIX family)